MLGLGSISTVNPYIGSVILTLAVCYFTWYLWNKKPEKSPPGDRGFPLLGVLPSVGRLPERQMAKWAKKYGPLYLIKLGPLDVVVISSPEVAYEAFTKHDCFNDRPQKAIPLLRGGQGIVMLNYGDFHKEQRRFGLNALREFGMGRRSLEPQLFQMSRDLCDKIDQLCGEKGMTEPVEIHSQIYELINSVISCIMFGRDIGKESEEFHQMILRLTQQPDQSKLYGLLILVPFLRHFPVFSAMSKRSEQFQKQLHSGIRNLINEHQKSRDPNNPRDFIDCFLNEMDKAEAAESESVKQKPKNTVTRQDEGNFKNVDEDEVEEEYTDFSENWKRLSSFYEDQLVALVRDLFVAGTETTATSLLWIILFLSKYSDVQKKMQDEIDDVLGQSGVPRMAMMEKLPYVRAVIQEISRVRPNVPLSVPHMASRDATLLGYRIPKGAIIFTNIWAIHHDESRWPEPEKFSPERHLDSDRKFMKNQNWMIFNVGGRSCLGQQLAKMELFISTVTLFQRFTFSLPDGEIPDMDGQSIISLRPNHYKVVAARR